MYEPSSFFVSSPAFVGVVIFIGEGVGLGVRNGAFKIPTMNHESSFSHPTVRWLYLFYSELETKRSQIR